MFGLRLVWMKVYCRQFGRGLTVLSTATIRIPRSPAVTPLPSQINVCDRYDMVYDMTTYLYKQGLTR